MLNFIRKDLTAKLVCALILTLVALTTAYTWYTVREDKKIIEQHLEQKGFALAKAAAKSLETMVENDIKKGVITEEALFNRNYTVFDKNSDAKKSKYHSAFDSYTDANWQGFVDGFLSDEDVLFAIPLANGEGDNVGYLPTHNSKYKDRSKRIFNDKVGVNAALTKEPLKQVYFRDTGEVAWDLSHPIYINGKHWGGYRVAIGMKRIEAQIAAKRNQTITSMVILTCILAVVIFMLSRMLISRPLNRILKELNVNNGDLTQRLTVSSSDEIGIISGHVNSFIEKVQGMVQQLVEMAQNVTSSTEMMFSHTEQATNATRQVALAIEQVAGGVNEQSRSMNDIVKDINEVSRAVEQIAAGAKGQSTSIENTNQMVNQMIDNIDNMAKGMEVVREVSRQNGVVAANGGASVEKTVNGMLRVKEAVTVTSDRINDLGEQSQKIGEIIQVIDDIAEQTNLLALNAAIEAARAGEHGKGFAVVADEVRKLAERSGKATKEIADLITSIQSGTNTAVESMRVGIKEVEEGAALAQEAGDSLSEIVIGVKAAEENVNTIIGTITDILNGSKKVSQATNEIAAIAEENSTATEKIAGTAKQADYSLQNISAITEETAASAEEVSASTEQITATTEEISGSAAHLAKMAQNLQTLIGQFKV